MTRRLLRLQDCEGRGPFRPGFSAVWRDEFGHDLPPIYVDLGIPAAALGKLIPYGHWAGCACRSEDELYQWFSRRERRRLKRLGYETVSFVPDRVIAETRSQVFFAMRVPLSDLPRPVA